jgi:hypothetical protein
MASETPRVTSDLDAVARALAEAHAREAGLSFSDYLTKLIFTANQGGAAGENLQVGSWRTSNLSRSSPQPNIWVNALDAASRGLTSSEGTSIGDWGKPAAKVQPWVTIAPTVSPALHLITVFNDRIQGAALLMSAAFLEAAVSDFRVPPVRLGSSRGSSSSSSWYERVISTCLVRSREVRSALTHQWQPTARAEQLAINAFVLLTDLTPARTELLQLCRYDRPRAFSELAKHLDLVTNQFSLSANLLAEIEAAEPALLAGERRFADTSAALLERAGGGVSLTEGAKLLRTTRQALHKRIKSGSALGMMQGNELVLPRLQFVTAGDRTHLIEGLSQVIGLFDQTQAGGWSALQFLIERDPNLGDAPIRILSEGRVDTVVNAARAYLGLDEG